MTGETKTRNERCASDDLQNGDLVCWTYGQRIETKNVSLIRNVHQHVDHNAEQDQNLGQVQGSSVYGVSVLAIAKLKKDSSAAVPRKLLAERSASNFCFSVGNQVQVFDHNCAKLLTVLTFDSEVAQMHIGPKSVFVVYDMDGNLHFINLDTSEVIATFGSSELSPKNPESRAIWGNFSLLPDGRTRELQLLLSDMTLLRVEGIEALVAGEDNELKNLKIDYLDIRSVCGESTQILDISVASLRYTFLVPSQSYNEFDYSNDTLASHGLLYRQKSNTDLTTKSYFSTNAQKEDYLIMAGKGEEPLTVWKREQGECNKTVKIDSVKEIFIDTHAVRVELDGYNNKLVVLNSDGELSIWDSKNLIMLETLKNRIVDDFILCDIQDGCSKIIYTVKCEGTNNRRVEVAHIFPFKITHHLDIEPVSFLIRSPFTVDNTGAISIYVAEYNQDISSWSILGIFETAPIDRFQYLIRKGLFNEATDFGNKYNLHSDDLSRIVIESRLERFLESINLSKDMKERQALFEELLENLNGLNDQMFSINFLLNAKLSSLEMTSKFITQARIVSQKLCDADYSHKTKKEIIDFVQGIACKFGTFQFLEIEKFSRTNKISGKNAHNIPESLWNYKEWDKFRNTDIISVIKDFLCRKDVLTAISIWKRHYHEKEVNSSTVELLVMIPSSTPLSEWILWLRDGIFPTIRDFNQREMINKWVEERARYLASSDKKVYEALEVANILDYDSSKTGYSVLLAKNSATSKSEESEAISFSQGFHLCTPVHYVDHTVAFSYDPEILSHGKPMLKPDAKDREFSNYSIKVQLEHLVYLWDVHEYHISLEDLSRCTPVEIAKNLLDRVTVSELLPDSIKHGFLQYVELNCLNYNQILTEYCIDIIYGLPSRIPQSIQQKSWQDRVLAVLSCISDPDSASCVVMELMKSTEIPWDDFLDGIFVKAIETSGFKKELNEQYQFLKLKAMLLNYNITNFNVSDKFLAKPLLFNILSRVDREDAIEGAMQVVNIYNNLSANDAYVIRLGYLFENGLIDRGILLLRSGRETSTKKQPINEINNPILDTADILKISKEVMYMLVESIDEATSLLDRGECPQEVKKRYEALVESAVKLTGFLTTSFEKALREDDFLLSFSVFKDDLVEESLFYENELTDEEGTLSIHKANKVFKSLHLLSQQYDLLIRVSEILNTSVRIFIVRHFSRICLYEDLAFFNGCVTYNILRNSTKKSSESNSPSLKRKRSQSFSINNDSVHDFIAVKCPPIYRLGEILKLKRSHVCAILAEEAITFGDFELSMVLCKHTLNESPENTTAVVLKHISRLMIKSVHENVSTRMIEVSRSTKSSLTSNALNLSQWAVYICSDEYLGPFLEDYKNCEILHAVFSQCDSGDYESFLNVGSILYSGKKFLKYSDFTNTKSRLGRSIVDRLIKKEDSSPTSSTSSNSQISKWGLDMLETLRSRMTFASTLFSENFVENSLVLETKKAMELATCFVIDSTAVQYSSPYVSDFNLLTGPQNPENGPNEDNKKHLEPIKIYESSNNLIDYLINCKSLQTSLRVEQRTCEIAFRQKLQACEEYWEGQKTVYSGMVQRLVSDVLSSKKIDQKLAYACLLSLPMEDAFEAYRAGMTTTGDDFLRLLSMANIGIAVATIWQQKSFKTSCQELAISYRWWHRLTCLGIPFEREQFQFRTTPTAHQRFLLSSIVKNSKCDIKTALEFAKGYSIEEDYVYCEYIKVLLFGNCNYENQKLILKTIPKVNDRENLAYMLMHDCIDHVSPYNYEQISFISNLCLDLKPEYQEAKYCKEVIDVLFPYTRASSPSIGELIDSARRCNSNIVFESPTYEQLVKIYPLSTKRLPYHEVIFDVWKTIGPELSKNSIRQLSPLAKIMNLDTDKMYTLTIQRILKKPSLGINSIVSDDIEIGRDSQFSSKKKLSFESIEYFVNQIKDHKTAMDILIEISHHDDENEFKIEACKMALARSQQYLEKLAKDSEYCIPNIDYDYRPEVFRLKIILCEVEHILRVNNLTEMTQYMTAQDNMRHLMYNLYYRKSNESLKNRRVNLHSIVDLIAERNGIDPDQFRKDLIDQWLSMEVESSDKNKDLYLPSTRVQIEDLIPNGRERALQLRIFYVLTAFTIDEAIENLLMYVTQQSSRIPTMSRIRALTILFKFAGPDKLRSHGYAKLKKYMQILLYLADFEESRIVISLKEFESCDKKSFVQSLWVQHKNEIKVVQLICNICLDYNVYETQLLECAIFMLIERNAFFYLVGVLEQSPNILQFNNSIFISKIWDVTIQGYLALLKSENAITYMTFSRITNLLQKCAYSIDISVDYLCLEFYDIYKSGQVPDGLIFAMIGLCSLPKTVEVSNTLDVIISKLENTEILTILNKLYPERSSETNVQDKIIKRKSSGFWPSKEAKKEQDVISSEYFVWVGRKWPAILLHEKLDENHGHDLLVDTVNFESFVHRMMQIDNIERTIIFLLRTQRISLAFDMVYSYYHDYYPDLLADNLSKINRSTENCSEEDNTVVLDKTVHIKNLSKHVLLEIYLLSHKFGDNDKEIVSAILDKISSINSCSPRSYIEDRKISYKKHVAP